MGPSFSIVIYVLNNKNISGASNMQTKREILWSVEVLGVVAMHFKGLKGLSCDV